VLWTGRKYKSGYGRRKYQGKDRRAHRVVYEQRFGPIPQGMCVCHRCDTPACINPDHLFLGTHEDNMADMVKKERSAKTKLTWDDVNAIRAARGLETGVTLAKRYAVSPTQIAGIHMGRFWKVRS
jgi:hypothetical protein